MKNNKKQSLTKIVSIIAFALVLVNIMTIQNWVLMAITFLAIPMAGYVWDLFSKEDEVGQQ